MLKLLGIAVIVAGFALRLESAAGDRCRGAGHRPRRRSRCRRVIVSAFGKAFNQSRYVSVVWLVLPVIGVLERAGPARTCWHAGVEAQDADDRATCSVSTLCCASRAPRWA
jgi:uncharacterized membrane protein